MLIKINNKNLQEDPLIIWTPPALTYDFEIVILFSQSGHKAQIF